MRERRLIGLAIAAVLCVGGCSGGAGGPATVDRSDLAAVGLERGIPPAVPDPNEDAVASMCGGLVVVHGTPDGLFDAETGNQHDLDLRLPGDEASDPEEFRIVSPPACVRDGDRWIVAVEFIRVDGGERVLAGFDDAGEQLWSRDGLAGTAAVGATFSDGTWLLDPATGEVLRKVRSRNGPPVLGVDRSRYLEVTDDPADVARFIDADGQPLPGAVPVFDPALVQGAADVVLGRESRFASHRTSAYDPRSGKRLWTVPIGHSYADRATSANLDRSVGALFWLTGSGESPVLHAVDARTGNVRWRQRLAADSAVTVAAGVGMYADGDTPHLFDARTGEPLRLDGGVWPLAVSDAGLLVLDEDDEPRLVDPRDVTTPQRERSRGDA